MEKLSKTDGSIIWRKSIPKLNPELDGDYLANIATLANGNCVIGDSIQGLIVISPSGNVLYSGGIPCWLDQNTGFIPPMIPRLAVSGNNIYVSTNNFGNTQAGAIVCYDQTLTEKWRVTSLGGYPITNCGIAVYGGVLWADNVAGNGSISTINLTNGSILTTAYPIGIWSGPPANSFIYHNGQLSFVGAAGIFLHTGQSSASTTSTTVGAGFPYYPIQTLVGNEFEFKFSVGCANRDFVYLAWGFSIVKYPVVNGALSPFNQWAAPPGQPQTVGVLGIDVGFGLPGVTAMSLCSNGDLLVSGGFGVLTGPFTHFTNVWCFDSSTGVLKWEHSQEDEFFNVNQLRNQSAIWSPPYKTGQTEVSDGYIFVSQLHLTPTKWGSSVSIVTSTTAAFTE